MPKRKLNKATIKALTSTDPRGTRYLDGDPRGFGCTAYADGRRVFFVRYGPRNRRRFYTIGEYDPEHMTVETARAEARRIRREYDSGEGDAAMARRKRAAVPIWRDWIIEYHADRKRTRKSADRELCYLKDASEYFGAVTLDEIGPRAIKAARQSIADRRGMVVANRWLSAVRACFRAAVGEEVVDRDPSAHLELYHERPRAPRILTDAELARLMVEIEKLTDPWARAALLLLIGTGARKGEVLSARWEDVDLEGGVWRLPDPKSGHPQTVMLAPGVVELLRTLPRMIGSPWVIPGRTPITRRQKIESPWREVRAAAKLTGCWIHDLRRTFADRVSRASDLQVASQLLRHANISTTAAHYAPANAERLRTTLSEVVGSVIPWPKAK